MADNTSASAGIGIGGLLLVAFIILKVLHKITWSWWWVLSPIWIEFALVGAFLLVIGIVALIASVVRRG